MTLDPDLIAMIYEAAAIPAAWPATLEHLAGLVGGAGGAIVSVDGTGGTRFIATEAYQQPYEIYASMPRRNVRPERALARQHFGFLPDVALCTVEELQADPIYQEVLFPFGLGWTIGAAVSSPSADLAFFDFCRRASDDPFGDEQVMLLDAYRPHLARAALLAMRLNMERALAVAATLSQIGIPGAVLGAQGEVLAANHLLAALSPRIEIGAFDRIVLKGTRAGLLFRESLAALGSAEPGLATGSIPMPAEEGAPALVLHLIPIKRTAHDVFGGASTVLLVTPVTAPSVPLTGVLAGLFDLTPAEAKVARQLAEGRTLRQIGLAHGVGYETVRSQLHSIRAKTGTHRQSDLVRLLFALSPPGRL